MMRRIRVALVEDNRAFLDEVRLLLAQEPCIEVVGGYTTGPAALQGIVATGPEVALIDLALPGGLSGVELIRCLAARGCPTECLVLTVFDDDAHLFPALQAGAVGYIVKDAASLPALVRAIQDVRNGEAPMSMGIARRVLQAFRTAPQPAGHSLGPALTPREREVLELLAQGHATRKVAALLSIRYATVRCYQKHIYTTLQVHSRAEAVAVFRGEKSF